MTCIACAGEHDRPDFDYCRCCGYGEPAVQSATNQPPPESNLARAIRQARGLIEPDDVPGVIDAMYGRRRQAKDGQ